MYKLSNFTIVIPSRIPGEYLLYNTITETLLNIQDEQKKLLGDDSLINKNFSEQEKAVFDELCDLNFFVKDELDEIALANKALWAMRNDTEILDITILPTYWCNLNCPYCYQKELDRSLTMNEELCEKTISWIVNKLDEFESKILNVKFFGGEALGKMALLKTFCNSLLDIAAEKTIELNFSLTTNGTLLTPSRVNELLTYGINTIKVTIDGDEATHNIRRPYLNGMGSFTGIVNNLLEHADKLNIILRCNYDQDNFHKIIPLLDDFARKGLNTKLKYIELQPVLYRNDFSPKNNNSCGQSFLTEEQNREYLVLIQEALNKGFELNPELANRRCPAFFKASFLIDPLGDIYKCPAFLGNSRHSLGNVNCGEMNQLYKNFLNDASWRDCGNCKFTLICCGGCRYAAQERYGDFFNKRVCEKDYFEKITLKLLEISYTKMQSNPSM